MIHKQQNTIESQQLKIFQSIKESQFLQTGSVFKSNTEFNRFSKINTLKISGIVESPDESVTSLKRLIVEIGDSLNVTLREEDIVACSRIHGGRNGLTPGVLVTFLEPEDRDAFLVGGKVKSSLSSGKPVSFSPQAVVHRSTRVLVNKCEFESRLDVRLQCNLSNSNVSNIQSNKLSKWF